VISDTVRPVRGSRLVHLLMLLQRREHTTAAQLADELEVSPRTVYRDLEALGGIGVPILATSGPGGGVRLLDGWQTRLTGMTEGEATALNLAGVPEVAAQLGLGSVLVAAQAKVDAALPPELRRRSVRLRERFLVDVPGWFERIDDLPSLAPLSTAVWDGRRVELRYRRPDRVVRRRVDPLGLVLKGATWYLVAGVRRPEGLRTYRLDRVVAVQVLDEPAHRPPAFRLDEAWRELGASFDRRLRPLAVHVRVRADRLGRLRHALVAAAAAEAVAGASAPDAEGWCTTTVHVESIEVGHDELLRMGADLVVLEPAELRDRLAATAAAMTARYAPDTPLRRRRAGSG
jgi:predicted DNA-binding transcriptional regulator YafY